MFGVAEFSFRTFKKLYPFKKQEKFTCILITEVLENNKITFITVSHN